MRCVPRNRCVNAYFANSWLFTSEQNKFNFEFSSKIRLFQQILLTVCVFVKTISSCGTESNSDGIIDLFKLSSQLTPAPYTNMVTSMPKSWNQIQRKKRQNKTKDQHWTRHIEMFHFNMGFWASNRSTHTFCAFVFRPGTSTSTERLSA